MSIEVPNSQLSARVQLVVDGWRKAKEEQIFFTQPGVYFKDIFLQLDALKLSLFPEEKFHVPVSKVEDFGIVTPKTSGLINISDKVITLELKRKKSKEARAEMRACQDAVHCVQI